MPRALPLLLLLAAAGPAAAVEPPSAADLTGARSLSLAAYRGLAGGNDALFTNAASLAASRRYALEASGLHERTGADKVWQWLQLSVVDSQTAGLTGGFAWTRVMNGPSTGNLYHLAVAGALAGGLHAGLAGKYLDLRRADGTAQGLATGDASLFWRASHLVGIGLAGYNLASTANRVEAPAGLGAGIGIGDERSFHLVVDWRRDRERLGHGADSWSAGGEILLLDLVPVRAGWLKDGVRGFRAWSAGAGLVSAAGVALDLAYRRSIGAPVDQTFLVALKLFLPTLP